MPLSEIQAKTKEELVSKIIKELESSQKHTHEQAIAIALAEAKRRGFDAEVSMAYHEPMSISFGKAQDLQNVLRVPVTLVVDMFQTYHISELPFLDGIVETEFIKVKKDWDEIKKAFQDLKDRKIDSIPYVEPHTNAIFQKDQIPKELQEMMTDYIQDSEIKGYIKEFSLDEVKKSLKAVAYITVSKADPDTIKNIKDGKVVNVSIGFTCSFDGLEAYLSNTCDHLIQRGIQIGHLAGLPHARGKCPTGLCGLGQDSSKTWDDKRHMIGQYLRQLQLGNKPSILLSSLRTDFHDPQMDKSTGNVNSFKYTPNQIQHNKVKPMATLEEVLAQLTDAQKEIAQLKGTQSTAMSDELKTAKFQLVDANKKIADLETEKKECGKKLGEKDEEIKKLKEKQKDVLITEITSVPRYKDGKFDGKELKEYCNHDLELIRKTVSDELDKKVGFNKPPQAERDSKTQSADAQKKEFPLVGVSPNFDEEKDKKEVDE
jgi:TolA-binding protein